MPQIMNYAIEIRMYTWGLFFVTMFYLYGIKWKKSNKEMLTRKVYVKNTFLILITPLLEKPTISS